MAPMRSRLSRHCAMSDTSIVILPTVPPDRLRSSAICLMPKDLPDPGEPNTATESGRSGRGFLAYAHMRFAIDL